MSRRRPGTYISLEELGRTRLSKHFFMRDFLQSEIGNFYGRPNIPDDPDLAIAADKADDESYGHAKKVSAKFFGEQILPTAAGLYGAVTAGSGDLFALTAQQLA